jgi:outer membrane receptor protein involved in Fe transport
MVFHSLRATLLTSTIITAAALALPASAQDVSPPAASTATGTDAVPPPPSSEIVVTGSRIARPELSAATPVAVLSNQAIEQTGAANVIDALAQLPAVGQNFSRTSSNFSTSGNGQSLINLRNLGTSRTLTLINGRRSVGVAGTSAVDINNIPTDLIERTEVLTGGASAVYGSEAVAGVVNFILKDKFEGFRVRAQNSVTGQGDDPHQFFSVTGGKGFADDRGHIVGNFSYDNDHGLRSRERAYSANDFPAKSSYAAQGLFSLDDAYSAANGKTYTFDQNNNLKRYQGAAIDGYNRAQDRYLSVPVERFSGTLLGNFEFSPAATIYAEGEFTHTRSNNGLEPSAVSNDPPNPAVNFDGSAFAIPITNPYMPAALRDAAIAAGVTTVDFRRRSNDIFSRSNNNARNYYRGVAGVRGDISPKWHYDVSYEHSEYHDHTTSQTIFARNYGAALNSVRDANGNIVCADAAARAAGCVPINIFGFNTVSPAAAAWLQTDPGAAYGGVNAGQKATFDYRERSKQDVVSGSVNGQLFSLWGDPISVSAGGEYRRESSSVVFDPYTQAGLTVGNQLSNTIGRFNVKEGFGEIVAPIVQDRPGLQYLGLEGAVRYADYSTVGGVFSWKAGGSYAPTRDIRFRAIYSRATRAPNISELFSAQSQTFPAINDPCDQAGGGGGDDPAATQALSATCRAIPGVANTVAQQGKFVYNSAQLQSIDGLTGGNPNLKQETANTITAGVVVTPRFIRGLSLTADYYHIKVKNAIGIIGQQVSVDECVASGNPLFCSNVIRDPNTGYIRRVNAINLNTGSFLVSGIDITGNYVHNLDFAHMDGTIAFNVAWTRLLKQQQTPFPGGNVQDEIGQADCYSCGRLGTGFRNKVLAGVTVAPGAFSLNYRVQYLSPVVDSLGEGATRIPAYFYHYVQARFEFGTKRQFAFYSGINNLTDKQPPRFGDTNLVTWPGTNTVADTYDLYGRTFYAGVEVKF